MKKMKILEQLKNKNFAMISLAVIFGVLLVQSFILLFASSPDTDGLTQIDTIFRTTMSSIFGFMISSSFAKEDKKDGEKIMTSSKNKQIGFGSAEQEGTVKMMAEPLDGQVAKAEPPQEAAILTEKIIEKRTYNNFKIIILTVLCLFCLTAMLIVRNFSELVTNSSYALVTMSSYRDFISSSIGALIGIARGGEAPVS